ncbi:MAG TPA: FAD-dependent monooxygenase [Methyloceanibacter sp.]
MSAETKTTPSLSCDILIVGGGFVGLTLALALAKLMGPHFRIALVDTELLNTSVDQDDARASALSAGSMHLLDAVGVWQALKEKAQPFISIEITDSPLDAALRPQIAGFDAELQSGEPGAYMVENADLRQALAAAVHTESAIEIIAPDSVMSFVATPLAVTATLASGNEIETPLLVAADGKRSRLRDQAGIKCVSWSYPQNGIVTTVAHSKPHHGKAVQHFLPSGPFAILPLKGNRSSIVWSEEKSRATEIMAGDEASFLAELTPRFGDHLGAIELAGPRQSFSLDLQIARRFVGNRFVLIGDAAHAVHPLAGQGLNIGIRDVAALTEIVVEGARLGLDIGNPVLLERYERWRRFDSALSATVMDNLNKLFSNDSAPLRVLRDLALGLVDRTPPLKRFFVREAAGLTGDVPRLLKGEMP